MPAPVSYDYAVVRVVPRVERGEFLNAGVIVYCLKRDFLGARVELDEGRLRALWPAMSTEELEAVRTHLAAIPRVCRGGAEAGPIGALSQKERWHWLVAPRSTVLQLSPVHSGLCEHPEETLERLMDAMVRVRAP